MVCGAFESGPVGVLWAAVGSTLEKGESLNAIQNLNLRVRFGIG